MIPILVFQMTDHGKQKEKKMENDFLHGLGVGVQESRDETEAESVHRCVF